MKNFKFRNKGFEGLEKAFDDMDSFQKRTKKIAKKDCENDIPEEICVPGSVYELPYGAFGQETDSSLKRLDSDQFHPMLCFFKYQETSDGISTSKWVLGTSKIYAINIKQKESENLGYVFELMENSMNDKINRQRYPSKRTYFFIHPLRLCPYRFKDSPSRSSYRGHIGETVFCRLLDEYNKILKDVEGLINA